MLRNIQSVGTVDHKILSFRTSDGRYGTAILSQAGKNGIGIGQANEALGL